MINSWIGKISRISAGLGKNCGFLLFANSESVSFFFFQVSMAVIYHKNGKYNNASCDKMPWILFQEIDTEMHNFETILELTLNVSWMLTKNPW